MKIKTQDLTGTALDWAVAKCEGMPERLVFGRGAVSDAGYCVERPNGTLRFYVLRSVWDKWFEKCETHPWGAGVSVYSPSTDWSQGGPIIEREGISSIPFDNTRWEARCAVAVQRTPARFVERRGPTPLIAAMRCYVASHLGDEVDIPEELL